MKYDLKVINFFGPPGTGKSTVASGLFNLMKVNGFSVEAINEFAKQMYWERRHPDHFQNQVYITAKQHNKQLNLVNHNIDYCITDSPLLLGMMYTPQDYYQSFKPLLKEMFDSYDNINILLKRTKKYDPIGRNQTEEESDQIGRDIQVLLELYNIPHFVFDATPTVHHDIFDMLFKPQIDDQEIISYN